MEIWYAPATMEVTHIYSHRYSGTALATRGLTSYQAAGDLPRGAVPGAVIEFDRDGKPVVVTPAPPPEPDPKQERLRDLYEVLKADTITDAEIRELMRLERGL